MVQTAEGVAEGNCDRRVADPLRADRVPASDASSPLLAVGTQRSLAAAARPNPSRHGGHGPSPAEIAAVQRGAGNAAVGRWLQWVAAAPVQRAAAKPVQRSGRSVGVEEPEVGGVGLGGTAPRVQRIRSRGVERGPVPPSANVAAQRSCAGPGECGCEDFLVQRTAAVQRQPGGGQADADRSQIPPDYIVHHNLSRQNFSKDPAQVKNTLELFLYERDDSAALKLFDGSDDEFVGPAPLLSIGYMCDRDPTACQKYKGEVIAIVRDQVSDLRVHMSEFRDDFQRRANDALNLLLDDSEAKIKAEKERYGLTKKEGMFSWLVGADYSMNNPQDLTDSAKALLSKFLELSTVTDDLKKCTGLGGTLPPGGTEAMCTPEAKASKEEAVKAKEQAYSELRQQKEARNPILITFDLDPRKDTTHGVLSTLASDSGEGKAELLYKQIDEKLNNIQTTRDYAGSHGDVIWKLPTVIGVAQKLPDIAGYPRLPQHELQNIVIEEAKSHAVVVDLIVTAALAAVSIGLGMLAAPLGAAGLGAAAGAAVATDAGIGVALMLKAIHEYEFEAAATNTDLDTKAKSISQDEPSLFWLALDIVMTVAQLKSAADEFRGLMKLSRAASAAKAAHSDEQAAKLFDELQQKGNDVKPGAGDRLRRETEELATSLSQDAGEIVANIDKVGPSSVAGYTHEIPMGEGKFWRRSAEGTWCFFASPPRCPLGVTDFILAPWLSGLTPETTAALMSSRPILQRAMEDARVGEVLEKYGVTGVKVLDKARFSGYDGLELLQRISKLEGRVKGIEQLAQDLAAGSSTTHGAIGELTYVEMLLDDGFEIERVADWINGKKAADIILKDGTVIDVKFYDWKSWRWQVPGEVEKSSAKMVEQVALRKKQYPGADIVYVFAGGTGDVPAELRKALEKAGATVKGSY